MNWTVDGLVIRVTEKTIESAEEVCPHVVVGGSAHYLGEHDSFGPVSNWLCCGACYEAAQEAQEERDAVETEVCFDCKLEKPRNQVMFWTWYDFYAAQGDEPLCVCKDCWTKEKHVQRRNRDQAEYEEEFGHDNDD